MVTAIWCCVWNTLITVTANIIQYTVVDTKLLILKVKGKYGPVFAINWPKRLMAMGKKSLGIFKKKPIGTTEKFPIGSLVFIRSRGCSIYSRRHYTQANRVGAGP